MEIDTDKFIINTVEGIRLIHKPTTYNYDIDKIVSYLEKFSKDIEQLYNWNANIEKLINLGVLSKQQFNLLNNLSPYEKEISLKEIICGKLNEFYIENRSSFDDLCLWIIKDWGGITGVNDENTLKSVYNFLKCINQPSFDRIASTSKIGSYMFPRYCCIYDSRVTYTLNWILLSQNAGEKFFPMPDGRNSKICAFDLNVLIRLKNVEKYRPNNRKIIRNRLYINNIDKTLFIPKKQAYTELNNLILNISSRLWDDKKSQMLYYTEMLLYSIADSHVFTDISKRVKMEIV